MRTYMYGVKITATIFVLAISLSFGMLMPAHAEKESSTNKLVAIVLPITAGSPRRGWSVPDDIYVKKTYKSVWKHLSKTGVYELIPWGDIEALIKERKIKDWHWRKDDWALLRKVGKELGADYAFVRERGFLGTLYSSMTLININTGKTFEYQDYIKKEYGSHPGEFIEIVKESYRVIFRNAKADLLATAISKAKTVPEDDTKIKETTPLPVEKSEELIVPHKGPEPAVPSAEKKLETLKPADSPDKDKKSLIVYDFNTDERLKVIALLLAETLREELSARFRIIAREDTMKAMDEMKLQQAGLIDEKHMMSIGKWLSTKEAVSGTFGLLGKTYLLQAKRINMETLETLSFGSIKASLDKEEELITGLSDLAVKLSSPK